MVLTVAGAGTGTKWPLAYHWAAAGVLDRALPWSIRAAGAASAALAHAEATALYRQSLDWWAQVEDPECSPAFVASISECWVRGLPCWR